MGDKFKEIKRINNRRKEGKKEGDMY